jgi:ferredoxin-NADP reductase
VEGLVDETPAARTLILRPPRGWLGHRAGQYAPVGVVIDGRRHVRTYSISSAPERFEDDECIAITVQAVARGLVSRQLAREVRRGDHLWLGPAQGAFVLPEATPARTLFVTAGSGITPVMGMLRSLEAEGALPDIVHVHHAPRRAEAIFAAELADLAKAHPRYRLHLVCTREGAEGAHLSPDRLARLCPDWSMRETWACGPEPLLEFAESHWRKAGLGARLHVERFRARLEKTSPGDRGGRVRFQQSGREIDADGSTSLLRAAEAAGLAPRHGCRMGICHSCTTTLRAGCVRDLRTGSIIDEPGTPVQICVCAAAGAVELEL